MAVYERTYRPYAGELTAGWSRFLIIPRYAYQTVFRSRPFLLYFALCFLPALSCAVVIYLHHNLTALGMLHLELSNLVPINNEFFFVFLFMEGWLAFFLALFIGPALVSPDLANNGMALYLSRPFSRWEYVLGKFSVLGILMSLITWIPGLILFLFQAYLEGLSWLVSNISTALAILLASWIWIVLLALMTMAASAWVRRKPIAAAFVLAYFFVSKGMGGAIDLMYATSLGDLIDVGKMCTFVWSRLFGVSWTGIVSAVPLWSAWASLTLFCGLCLWLLMRKVRAYEVVRS